LFNQLIDYASGNELQGFTAPAPLVLKPFERDPKNWKIVSFRIDPCAPELGLIRKSPAQCVQEIRLVVQPVSSEPWGIDLGDMALHVLWEVDRGAPKGSRKFQDLWKGLLRLKADLAKKGITTTGVPLKPHPGMKDPDFQSLIKTVLLSALGQAKLEKITFSGAATAQGPWLFFQGLVDGQRLNLERDPTLQNLPHGYIVPRKPGSGGEFFPSPTPYNSVENETSGPRIQDLFVSGPVNLQEFATLGNGDQSRFIRKSDIVAVIHNPAFSNRTNTDCFSCHSGTSRQLQLGLPTNGPFVFKAPQGTTAQAKYVDANVTDFRAFGWFGSLPVANQRVVNESTLVADFMKSSLE
jgi:hypothetical protein